MSDSKEKLFSEFPSITTDRWMEKINTDLKGADFEKKLVWKTKEGFNVKPFYREEDLEGLRTPDSLPAEFPFVRSTKKDNNWYVRQDIQVSDVGEANKRALNILERGVTSLGFMIKKEDVNREKINILLDGIYPECIELNFKTCNRYSAKLIGLLIDYFQENNINPDKCVGSVNMDFIGAALKKGVVIEDRVEQMKEAVILAQKLPYYRVIGVNSYLFNNAGSYITQELGYALAWGNEIMSVLTTAGLDAGLVASKIKFNFGIGSDYFMEIAKFRAARWLWAEIVNAYGVSDEDAKMNIFAQTSEFNQTVYDAHVNLLRTQTESMSAAIAGVDSLRVLPFDSAFKMPDDFSERIARNQQLLLKEESHFDKVVDPSGGSYYIENLTNSIAVQAWKLFLGMEEKGFFDSVVSGEVQDAVNASGTARFKALSGRREILLGTNQFPNFTEKASQKIMEVESGCGCGSSHSSGVKTLNSRRLSSDFEELRLATERAGKIPVVFMLTIGNLTMRLARSQFSGNFFACAGYQIIDNLGFQSVEEGIKAARDKGADIVVLCSSDDEYAVFAPEAYELTKGREILVVAGAPACTDELKAKGIEYFINVRSNVLDTLKEFNAKLNIK